MRITTSWLWQMFEIARTGTGVSVRVHWSVPAIALFILGIGYRHIVIALAWVISYLGMIVIHELGHQFAAQKLQYRVHAISIYPLHGECEHDAPHSQWHSALIAWGGPLAQLILAIPFAFWTFFGRSTTIAALDVIIAVFAVYSPIVALFNLLPIEPLDGKKAWRIVPLVWRRIRYGRPQSVPQTPLEALQDALRKAKRH